MVEVKYDGMRELTETEPTALTYKTREGRLDPKFDGVFDENLRNLWEVACEHLNTDTIWVDGEVLVENDDPKETFRGTMKARKSGADKSKLVYRIFEILTKEEWESKKTTRPLSERRATLERLIWIVADEDYNIQPSHGQVRYSEEEMLAYYEPLVARGAEGVIIKPMTSVYEWKRSKLWTKHTPVFTADLRITGRYLGSGKNENRLGGFNLEGELEDGTFVVADVGSGFSDAQRDEFWEMDEDLLCSMIAEIEYREVSYAKETPSLRFPAFKHIREDKSA
jgi:DNA ligase-1